MIKTESSPSYQKFNWFTLRTLLFATAIGTGIFLRFYNLGVTPLTENEAAQALQALEFSTHTLNLQSTNIGIQPLYIILTGLVFSIFGASEFLARFWPALSGSMLVFLPALFRHELGNKAMLVLAFALALDPSLVIVSRQANGPMVAVSLSILAFGFWHTRQAMIAGVFAGLALLGGPACFMGLVDIGITYAILAAMKFKDRKSDQDKAQKLPGISAPPGQALPSRIQDGRIFIISLLTTLLIVGTFLLQFPQGLTDWFESLWIYLQGWIPPSEVSTQLILSAFLLYEFFVLVFSISGIIHQLIQGETHGINRLLTFNLPLTFATVSLMTLLMYSGREVNQLTWTIIPLWVIASIEIAEYIPEKRPDIVSLLTSGLVLLLATLYWNTLISTDQIGEIPGLPWYLLRIALLGGIFALGLLVIMLIALGWSWPIARDGLVGGLSVVMLIYSISVLWGASQLRMNLPQELWSHPPATGQADLLRKTITDLSNWNFGMINQIDIQARVDTPSLRWELRDFSNTRFSKNQNEIQNPALIITSEDGDASGTSIPYRGQDFIWHIHPDWTGEIPSPFLNWFTFRQTPLKYDYLVLWARNDLFPGAIKTNP